MTDTELELIQDSFAEVLSRPFPFAPRFYERLFEADPRLRPLLKSGAKDRYVKFIEMLKTLVNGLADPSAIPGGVAELGRRHVDYGVAPEHYDVMRQVLLDTLAEGLGESWTKETADAWNTAYKLLSKLMINSGYKHHASIA